MVSEYLSTLNQVLLSVVLIACLALISQAFSSVGRPKPIAETRQEPQGDDPRSKSVRTDNLKDDLQVQGHLNEIEKVTLQSLPFEVHRNIIAYSVQRDVISYGNICRQFREAARHKLSSRVFVDGTRRLKQPMGFSTTFYATHTITSELGLLRVLHTGSQVPFQEITFSEPTLSVGFFNTFVESYPNVSVTIEVGHTLRKDLDLELLRKDLNKRVNLNQIELPAPINTSFDYSQLSTLEIRCETPIRYGIVNGMTNLSSLFLYSGGDEFNKWTLEFILQLPRENQLHTLSLKCNETGSLPSGTFQATEILHQLLQTNQESIERINVYDRSTMYLGLQAFERLYSSSINCMISDVEEFSKGKYPKLTLMILWGTPFAIHKVYGELVDVVPFHDGYTEISTSYVE